MRKAQLSIAATAGHGWTNAVISKDTVAENKIFVIQGWNTDYVFQLVDFEGDALEVLPISVPPAPVDADSGVRLADQLGRTRLRVGQSIKMATPAPPPPIVWEDIGTIWEVTLLGIIEE